jgi:RHS repeat-associated protein
LGSTTLSLDASGVESGEKRYTPWGQERFTSGTLPTQYTYTGQYSHTAQFGLMFFNARWFDPLLGRFSQPDTIIPGTGFSIAWDRYAGMANNPVKYADPSGHRVTCERGENCAQEQRLFRFTGERYWKALIKDEFGILMSD